MPSEQKPDINGFREGDRIRLVRPFNGETVSYEPGRTGTFLNTDTATAQIRLAREGFYEILMDYPEGRLIMVRNGLIERIPGHANVLYSDNGESIQIVYRPREPVSSSIEEGTSRSSKPDVTGPVRRIAL